jgi:hypothetical protein
MSADLLELDFSTVEQPTAARQLDRIKDKFQLPHFRDLQPRHLADCIPAITPYLLAAARVHPLAASPTTTEDASTIVIQDSFGLPSLSHLLGRTGKVASCDRFAALCDHVHKHVITSQ